jgi:hypothetical protein
MFALSEAPLANKLLAQMELSLTKEDSLLSHSVRCVQRVSNALQESLHQAWLLVIKSSTVLQVLEPLRFSTAQQVHMLPTLKPCLLKTAFLAHLAGSVLAKELLKSNVPMVTTAQKAHHSQCLVQLDTTVKIMDSTSVCNSVLVVELVKLVQN